MEIDIGPSEQKWIEEEKNIKKKVVCLPDLPEDSRITTPFKIGGADISFIPGNTQKAVCCYIVAEYSKEDQTTPEVIWKDLKVVNLGNIIVHFVKIIFMLISCAKHITKYMEFNL